MKMKKTGYIISAGFLSTLIGAVQETTVASCGLDSNGNPKNNNSEYFNTVQLQCQECPENTVPTDDLLGCECAPGFIHEDPEDDSFIPTCKACAAQQMSSSDFTQCLSCGSGSTWNTDRKQCLCSADNIPVESGTSLTCSSCVTASYRGPFDSSTTPICEPCRIEGMAYETLDSDPFDCQCSSTLGYVQAGEICYKQNKVSRAPFTPAQTKVTFSSIEVQGQEEAQQTDITSGVFDNYYMQATAGCTLYRSPRDCQILANLCVLQLYKVDTEVCDLILNMKDDQTTDQVTDSRLEAVYPDSKYDPAYTNQIPWIYYSEPGDKVVEQSKRIKFRASFSYEDPELGIISQLDLWISRYDIEGNFYGFQPLSNELVICDKPSDEIQRLTKIGTTVEIGCTIDLSRLVSENKWDHPRNENMFYDLYMRDYDGAIVDVPVLITNLQGNDKDARDDWTMTRRFFIFDTISGIESQDYPNGVPAIIRYAKSITLKIQLDPFEEEMIYVPYLKVEYGERRTDDILDTTGEDFALTTVSFSTEYSLSTEGFWSGAKAFFFVVLVIWIIICIVATVNFIDRPRLEQENATCAYVFFRLMMTALDMFSTLFFWYIFAMTGYWFVFFKLQERVYCFLPGLDTHSINYKYFDILFAAVGVSKLVFVICKLYFEQCNIDIFVIDWERPRVHQHGSLALNEDGKGGGDRTTFDVNAWRSMFVINELNECQTYRLINMEFTLLIFAFLMEGCGFRYWITHDPDLNRTNTNSPDNYTLFFFVAVFLMYCIGAIQYVFRYLLSFRFPLKHTEVVDLCSICNVSILMFDESFAGYYIHGKSPYGQAEISSEQLRKAIEFEASGQAQMRGMTEEDPDLQTFEIFIPPKLLTAYRSEYLKEVNSKISDQNLKNQELFSAFQRATSSSAAIPKGLNLEELEMNRKIMNRIMIRYIEQVRSHPKVFIRTRSWFERLLNRAPKVELNADKPVMYKDKWSSFSNNFMMGMDWDFLMLDCITMAFIETLFRNSVGIESRIFVGVLVAYLLDTSLVKLRKYFGRRNMSKHTLVDEAFLI